MLLLMLILNLCFLLYEYACKLWCGKKIMLLLMKMTLCLNPLWTYHYKVILRRKNDVVVHGRKCVD